MGLSDRRPPALALSGVSRSFGHVAALREVDVTANAGEMLAVVGDNGAGKSTLMGVISGLIRPDAGTIERDGVACAFSSPAEARAAGIATVTQDLALVECLDVATNMFLGANPRRGPFVDRRRMQRETRGFLDEIRASVADVRTPIGMLSGGQRQIIAIARALRVGADIVVLDEPTAALGVRETAHVGALVDGLREQGKAVICVSHDLEFVFAHADRIQVMRLGAGVATVSTSETSRREAVGLITGAASEVEAHA